MSDAWWDKVICEILVDGKPLVAYPPPKDDEIAPRHSLSYIEVVSDAIFQVGYVLPANFPTHGADRLGARIYVDGKKIRGSSSDLEERKDVYKKTCLKEIHRYDHESGTWYNIPVQFTKIITSEDHEAGRGDYDMRLQDLGTIKLVLRLAKSSGPGFAGEPDDCKEFELSSVSSRPVSERSLKGVDVSNTVKLAVKAPGVCPDYQAITDLKGPKGAPWTYEIRYRTRTQLQAIGCIPADPPEATTQTTTQPTAASAPNATATVDNGISANIARETSPISGHRISPSAQEATSSVAIKSEPLKQEATYQATETPSIITSQPLNASDNKLQLTRASSSSDDVNGASHLQNRLRRVRQRLSLLDEEDKLIAEIASQTTTRSSSNSVIKTEPAHQAIVKRESGAHLPSPRPAKRQKPGYVDLTDD